MSLNAPVVIYVTKYALTAGIAMYKVERRDINGGKNMVTVRHDTGYVSHFHGKDWHVNSVDALNQAEQMRASAIAACQRKIDKLHKLVFK